MRCPLCDGETSHEYMLGNESVGVCCSYRICLDCVSKLYTGRCPQCKVLVTKALCIHNVKIKKRTDFVRTQPFRETKRKKISNGK